MNISKTLVLLGILFAAILIIENMVAPLQAYVFIWITKTYTLAIACILTWIILGYGIHGMLNEKGKTNENEDYDF